MEDYLQYDKGQGCTEKRQVPLAKEEDACGQGKRAGATVVSDAVPHEGGDGRKRPRALTRRAALGFGGVAAASLLVGTKLAWGGVGGGAWGSYGGTATPGASFGYDAGWSYSYDGCVWLSASCNCSVGRMTELFTAMTVRAFVACGGVWDPTWSPDMPDTPTYAYVRNDAGTWLASQYWIIDTTYDHSWYEYMVEAELRVSREPYDWRCWCGADIKGLGGSAPGTHSVAEAPQTVPRHVLVDDAWWHGRIVTLRPQAASHLLMDAAGGGLSAGTNVCGWESLNATNQNWIVGTSAQGRTCLVPVHVGANALFLDSSGATWDDGANVQLWTGNGSPAQSLYAHDLGDGYHLLVFECSGCALDLKGGGAANGTNMQQWNCYGNWNNPAQRFKLEEPVFHEEVAGSMALSGQPEVGGTLTAPDPAPFCIPRNYGATSGLFYRYTWFRGGQAGACEVVVQEAGEPHSYVPTEADAGSFITCVITAHTRFLDLAYKGEVQLPSMLVASPFVTVRFYADGEATPCFEDTVRRDQAYYPPEQASAAAAKPNCSGLDGWYRDSACQQAFSAGSLPGDKATLNLYARNGVTVSYQASDASARLAELRALCRDEACQVPVALAEVLPQDGAFWYGQSIVPVRGADLWYSAEGRPRQVLCRGAFATPAADGQAVASTLLMQNAVLYLDWRSVAFDGIAFS